VAELRPHVEELRAAGVDPWVVGSGTPAQARDFQRHIHAEDVPVVVDEQLVPYRAAGMKRSVFRTFHPKSWWKGVKSMIAHPQRRTAGDPFQLGGVMIVRPDGQVRYHYVSDAAGDHPPVATLVDEARKAAGA
jgi:alkyl-hydroperoxide reductase/thiol specific antioxidant family protein